MGKYYYEYDLTDDGFIIGWRTHPKKRRPDLKDNPVPIIEMSKFGFHYDSGQPMYKLENNKIVKPDLNSVESLEEENIIRMKEMDFHELINALICGIQSAGGGSNPKFRHVAEIYRKAKVTSYNPTNGGWEDNMGHGQPNSRLKK